MKRADEPLTAPPAPALLLRCRRALFRERSAALELLRDVLLRAREESPPPGAGPPYVAVCDNVDEWLMQQVRWLTLPRNPCFAF